MAVAREALVDDGRILFDAVTGHFHGDPDAACHYLIDQHPVGWLVLGGDITAPRGYRTGHTPGPAQPVLLPRRPPRTTPPPLTDRTDRDAHIDDADVPEPARLRVLTNRPGGWPPVAEPAWTDNSDWTPSTSTPKQLRRGR